MTSLVNTETGELVEALSAMERSDLVHAEATIEAGLASFVEVGAALAKVRDERLYREEYGTFETYCRERWGLSRSRAYAAMDASDLVSRIRDIGAPAPANQGQAEALVGLEPEAAAEVMDRAHEATGGKVTAAAIREARAPFTKPEAEAVRAAEITHYEEDRERQEGDVRFAARAAADEFPELTFYIENGRHAEAVRIATALRGYEPVEQKRRLELLRKTVYAERRAQFPDPPEVTAEDLAYQRAEEMFSMANVTAQTITKAGGAESIRQSIAAVEQIELDNWREQFLSLAALCSELAEACRPTLRRLK